MKVMRCQRRGRSVNGWREKFDGRESVDGSRLNNLTLIALDILKKKRQTTCIPLPLRLHVRTC